MDDFSALVLSGMQLSQYRTVPATVDVVTVQSYDLIEPLTAPLCLRDRADPGTFSKDRAEHLASQ